MYQRKIRGTKGCLVKNAAKKLSIPNQNEMLFHLGTKCSRGSFGLPLAGDTGEDTNVIDVKLVLPLSQMMKKGGNHLLSGPEFPRFANRRGEKLDIHVRFDDFKS